MFLTPHHFQQSDRYHEALLHRRLSAVQPRGWGLLGLQVNAESLGSGEFALSRCSAVFSDGLSVNAPDSDALPPARPLEGAIDPKKTSVGVYLASPLARPGARACRADDATDGPATRYYRRTAMLTDENVGANE